MSNPKVIVFEGNDRVGKSTIANSLQAMLPKSLKTYEPFFLTPEDRKHTDAFFDDRVRHLEYLHNLISSRKLDYIIMDRYIDSFFAYEKSIQIDSKSFKQWYSKHQELEYLFVDHTFLIKRDFEGDVELLDENDSDIVLQKQVYGRYELLKNKKVFWRNNMVEIKNTNLNDTIDQIYDLVC